MSEFCKQIAFFCDIDEINHGDDDDNDDDDIVMINCLQKILSHK